MNQLIEYLTIVSLVYLIIVLISFAYGKEKRKRKKFKATPDEVLALNLTIEEFQKAINFLLMYGIIDFNHYNEINIKSLPYLKG